LDFKINPKLHARNGAQGRGKRQAGEQGANAVAKVPVGTQIFDVDSGALLADLTTAGQQVVVCKGGNGGFGNSRFATPSRQAPEMAKPGLPGEARRLRLSLKLLADVGLLGFPNAGKSTFLSRISAARPKIASYPFTTLVPQLGVVEVEPGKSIVVADIPGVIEGAADGAGLGVRFLKHLERVRVLCHLIEVPLEMSDPGDAAAKASALSEHVTRGPVDLVARRRALRLELARFSDQLASLPELVVLTKTDVASSTDELRAHPQVQKLAKALQKERVPLLMMSCARGDGVRDVVFALDRAVRAAAPRSAPAPFNPFARVR
jgi:GTP-binding protein